MSGGIIIPGTAAASDVRNGKTFSSKNGFNLTGTGIVYTPTFGQQKLGVSNGISPFTITSVTTSTNSLLQMVLTGTIDGAVATSITDSAGNTWKKRYLSMNPANINSLEVWTTDGNTTALAAGTITITSGSATDVVCHFFEIPGAPLTSPFEFIVGLATTSAYNSFFITQGSPIKSGSPNNLIFGAASLYYASGAPTVNSLVLGSKSPPTAYPSSTTVDTSSGGHTHLITAQYLETAQDTLDFTGNLSVSCIFLSSIWSIRTVA